MSYDPCDFVDSIMDALGVQLDDEDYESGESIALQADACLEEIERLQRFEKEARHALAVLGDSPEGQPRQAAGARARN